MRSGLVGRVTNGLLERVTTPLPRLVIGWCVWGRGLRLAEFKAILSGRIIFVVLFVQTRWVPVRMCVRMLGMLCVFGAWIATG